MEKTSAAKQVRKTQFRNASNTEHLSPVSSGTTAEGTSNTHIDLSPAKALYTTSYPDRNKTNLTTPSPAHTTPIKTHDDIESNQSTPNTASSTQSTDKPHHTRLKTSISTLQSQITKTQAELTAAISQLQDILPVPSAQTDPDNLDMDKHTLHEARNIVRKHIRLLQQYNEIKDIGLGLIGLIAENEGRRISEVMADMGIEDDD